MVDPVLTAAAAADSPFLFGALKIEFPGYTLCLLDGSGRLTFGGNTYVGEDPTFGTIDSIDQISERIGDEAPELRLTLNPPDAVAAAQLASATMQGSRVTIYFGAFDPTTNAPIGTPEVIFLGEIDVPTIEVREGSRTVEFTVVSVFERLFEINEGERASDGWHHSIWPGERGFEHVTGTVKNLYWGAKRPVPQQVGNGWGSLVNIRDGLAANAKNWWTP
jgi:hypothetical protein